MVVNIFQPAIPGYRSALFSSLRANYGWDVHVYHSGVDQSGSASFVKHRLPCFRSKSVSLQGGLLPALRSADVNVLCFDLRWPVGLWHGLMLQSRVPLILWGHGFGRSKAGNAVRVRMMRRADRTIFYGHGARQEAIRRGVPAWKTVVAPNTVFVSNHVDTSTDEKEYLLYVGRLQKRKRLDCLFRAYAELRQERRRGLGLCLVGDGEMKTELRAYARALGIADSVELMDGTFNEAELLGYFRKAAAYVSPGAVGLGVLHAFAYGVPVLALRDSAHGPEVEWIENRQSGILVEDEEGLVRAMDELALSKDLATNMGREAYRIYCSEANPERMLEGFKVAVDGAVGDRVADHVGS